jgi:flagellar biosynthesis protein FlhB
MFLGEIMNSVADEEIDEIAQKILLKIEHASSRELAESDEMIKILHLTNAHHAKTLLQHMDEATTRSERDVGKKAVIKALLLSTWHQRLYFIVRSMIMGILSASVTFLFVLYFGSINIRLQAILGIFTFMFSLTASRLFDVQIVKATKKIVAFLGNHKSLRDFILNHF